MSDDKIRRWVTPKTAASFIRKSDKTVYRICSQHAKDIATRDTPDGMILDLDDLLKVESQMKVGRPRAPRE